MMFLVITTYLLMVQIMLSCAVKLPLPIEVNNHVVFPSRASSYVIEQTMPPTSANNYSEDLNDTIMTDNDLQSTKVDPSLTLFTTYTYFTTFFREGSTLVKSHEIVFTPTTEDLTETTSSIVPANESTEYISPSKVHNYVIEQTTPPTSGIYNAEDLNDLIMTDGDLQSTKADPSLTLFTTFTYFSTYFNELSTVVKIYEEVNPPAIEDLTVTVFNNVDLKIKNIVPSIENPKYISPSKQSSYVIEQTTPPTSGISNAEDLNDLILTDGDMQMTPDPSLTKYTTLTFFTTYFIKGSPSVNISTETITDIVPRINISPSKTISYVIEQTTPPTSGINEAEGLNDSIMTDGDLQSPIVDPSLQEVQIITETYFTTRLIKGSTIVNSRKVVVTEYPKFNLITKVNPSTKTLTLTTSTFLTTTHDYGKIVTPLKFGIFNAEDLIDLKMTEVDLQSTKVDPSNTKFTPFLYFTTFSKEGTTFVTRYEKVITLTAKDPKETTSNIVPAIESTKYISPSKTSDHVIDQNTLPTSKINNAEDNDFGRVWHSQELAEEQVAILFGL